jgi:hypothetical protein
VALTFGAAVGDVAPDPVLPDQALRSPRYTILGILLPPASPAAGPLRKRFDAGVHMREISPAALQYVEDAVRGDLRHASALEFFETLRAEPLYPEGDEHVMDRSPELFGWRVWRFHADTRALSDPIASHRTRSGATYFEAECGPGLVYVTSAFYCAWLISELEQSTKMLATLMLNSLRRTESPPAQSRPNPEQWGATTAAKGNSPCASVFPPPTTVSNRECSATGVSVCFRP